ncbi:MAG TPA: hypothetical protein VNE16_04675 [Vicinamibacterales bacterium]|nr:hypothetical protein [Vicinamibacterales bacterium]
MKVCPFCLSDVPMTAAICPKCRADLVQYRPGVQISEPAPPGRGWRLLLAIFVGIFIVAASIGVYLPLMSDRPAPPAWRQVGHAGDVRFLVVPPAEAASDAVLWRIADRLRGPAAMIHLMFWTSAAGAPTRGLPTAAQRGQMAAEIIVNVGAGVHELRRGPGSRPQRIGHEPPVSRPLPDR